MEVTDQLQFEVWDWVLFAAMLAVSVGIGIFYALRGRNQNTTGAFLMGGRNMQLIPVAISILVSFSSAIVILGTSAEMYTAGTMYFLYVIGLTLALILAAQVFVPLFYPLKLTSSFEYLERRFESRTAKLTGTLIMIVQQIFYSGIAIYAPSTALEAVSGLPVWATIITVGLVSTCYTFLGGMKAVVWTDVFQSVVMLAGLLAIVVQGILKVGSLEEVIQINDRWNRIQFNESPYKYERSSIYFGTNGVIFTGTLSYMKGILHPTFRFYGFSADPTVRHSFWTVVVGRMVSGLASYGVNQSCVQRYCSVGTLKQAKGVVLLNIIGTVILVTIICLAGIVVFAYYAQRGCDPLRANLISNSNQIIPHFVTDVLGYPGLPGLFVACLFSGALRAAVSKFGMLHAVFGTEYACTTASCLNALSAVTWQDLIKPFVGDIQMSFQVFITRLLVVFYGAAGVAFAFIAQNLGGTVLQISLSFTGATSGPLLGIFLLGGLFPWANWIGCTIGGFLGLVFPLWISVGAYSIPGPSPLDTPISNCSLNGISNTTTVLPLTSSPYQITGIEHLYTVSYLWYPSIGTATVVIMGLAVSFMTGPMQVDKIDPKLLIPLFDRIGCCLPKRLRRIMRCNLDFLDPEDIKSIEKDKEIVIYPSNEKKEHSGSLKESSFINGRVNDPEQRIQDSFPNGNSVERKHVEKKLEGYLNDGFVNDNGVLVYAF